MSWCLARLMRIFHDWRDLPPDARGATVALGNFDGVHLGHASVIRAAHAARPDAPLAVLTFEPHPREVFRPDDPPFRLTLPAERADALAALGVDLLYELRFNHDFSLMSAEDFVARCCTQGSARGTSPPGRTSPSATGAAATRRSWPPGGGAGHGPDPGAAGDGRAWPAVLHPHPPRAAGRLSGAGNGGAGPPLGDPGEVAHGDKRGRSIGFPTANVRLGRHLEPARGVYAVTLRLADGTLHKGVANIGRRPTVNADTGKPAGGEPVRFRRRPVRPGHHRRRCMPISARSAKFSGLDALKAQIAPDAAEARRLLE